MANNINYFEENFLEERLIIATFCSERVLSLKSIFWEAPVEGDGLLEHIQLAALRNRIQE